MAIEIKYTHTTEEIEDKEDLGYYLGYHEDDGYELCGVWNNTLIFKKRIS